MTTTHIKKLAVIACATTLALSACGDSGSSHDATTEAAPPVSPTTVTETDTGTGTPQPTGTPPTPPSQEEDGKVYMSQLRPDCNLGIESTVVQAFLDRGSLPVVNVNGPQDGEITDLEILTDAYAPCDGLSYAVVGGTYKGEAAAFPVVFSHGATVGNVAKFVGSPDMQISKDGNQIHVFSSFSNVDVQATYAADTFGSVTERSQASGGIKVASHEGVAELIDATPHTTAYAFPLGDDTAQCLVGPEHLEYENPNGTWAFNKADITTTAVRYDYGAHDMSPTGAVDDASAITTVQLTAQHTIVGPPGHLMYFHITGNGLVITTPGEMKIRIASDYATMEMPATITR